MIKNKKLVLILLIAFVVVTTSAFFLAKLKDMGYLGKKNNGSANLANIGEPRDFQGRIASIDLEKKSILIRGADILQIAKNADSSTFEFSLANDPQIILKEWKDTREISLADLWVNGIVLITAQEKTGGILLAKKVIVSDSNSLSGKVTGVENGKINVIRNNGAMGGTDEIYTVILNENTKINVVDKRKIFTKEKDKPDLSKVSEKTGTISDIQVDSLVVITPEAGVILQGEKEFISSNIKIILN